MSLSTTSGTSITVTGLSNGTATITATAGEDKTVTFNVTVEKLDASEVSFTPSQGLNWNVNNVQEALDYLYEN